MIMDTVIYIDSPLFCEAQYQGGNEIYVCCSKGRDILVYDVSEKTFLKLQKNPTHKTILNILNNHLWKYVP